MPTKSPITAKKISRASPQFSSFYDELNKLLKSRDAIALLSTLESGSTNQNTSASRVLSSFVNSNKQNLCLDHENSKEENNNTKREKRSKIY